MPGVVNPRGSGSGAGAERVGICVNHRSDRDSVGRRGVGCGYVIRHDARAGVVGNSLDVPGVGERMEVSGDSRWLAELPS
jgi:hypothetical protein